MKKIPSTKEEFITAFWKLYKSKPIEKISVSRLCQQAGYNRSTFYHHFADIYDLLDQAVDDICSPARERISSMENYLVFLQENEAEATILDCFSMKREWIELLFQRQSYYLLGEKIKKELLLLIKKQFESSEINFETLEMLLEYQMSAILGVINYWYKRGKPIPEQAMLQEIYSISSRGVLNALKDEIRKAALSRQQL